MKKTDAHCNNYAVTKHLVDHTTTTYQYCSTVYLGSWKFTKPQMEISTKNTIMTYWQYWLSTIMRPCVVFFLFC